MEAGGRAVLRGRQRNLYSLQTSARRTLNKFLQEKLKGASGGINYSESTVGEYQFAATEFDPGRATRFESTDALRAARRNAQAAGGVGKNPSTQTNIGRDAARNSRADVTKKDRKTPSPDKIKTAGLVPQTLRQADYVAEREMVIENTAAVPMLVFAKLYIDPDSPTGQLWHFVEVRKNSGMFETQYSDTNPQSGRALVARVVGIGDSTPKAKKKKPDSQVGYGQASRGEVNPQNSQAIEPLPESRATNSQVGYGQAVRETEVQMPVSRSIYDAGLNFPPFTAQ